MPGCLVIDSYAQWIRLLVPDSVDQEWLFSKFVRQPLATYTQPIRLGSLAAAVPRAFVFCTEGKEANDVFASTATRLRTAPGWRYRELTDNHMAPINTPEATAEVILSLT